MINLTKSQLIILIYDKDIVEVWRTRRLSYFGHVARMTPADIRTSWALGTCYSTVTSGAPSLHEDDGTTSQKTVKHYTSRYQKPTDMLRAELNGEA